MPIWRRPKHSGTTGGDKSKKTNGQPPNTLPPSRPSTGKSLEDKLDWFQQQFENCSDVIVRQFDLSSGQSSALIYIRGLINQTTAQDFIIRSLQEEADSLEKHEEIYKFLFEDKGLSVSQNKIIEDMNEGLAAILDAGALLLIDGDNRMMTFSISSYPTRSIEEPPNESVIRGPREAFIEDLEINLTLMRRRLKNKDFKTESLILGTKTKTDIVLTYIDGICKPELVDEMKRRLSYIEIDSVLGSSYVEESIEDNPYSPFPQVQYTERPDVVSAALLEGRLGLFVDGTPMALIVPVTLTMLLQSSEDYFQRFIAATWIRWIRFFFLSFHCCCLLCISPLQRSIRR